MNRLTKRWLICLFLVGFIFHQRFYSQERKIGNTVLTPDDGLTSKYHEKYMGKIVFHEHHQ